MTQPWSGDVDRVRRDLTQRMDKAMDEVNRVFGSARSSDDQTARRIDALERQIGTRIEALERRLTRELAEVNRAMGLATRAVSDNASRDERQNARMTTIERGLQAANGQIETLRRATTDLVALGQRVVALERAARS